MSKKAKLVIDMPIKCIHCPIYDKTERVCKRYPFDYLDPNTAAEGKPKWCPLKSEKKK